MPELPKGWMEASLSDIVEIRPRHPRDLAPDTPVSFVPMPAVSADGWQLGATKVRPFKLVRQGYTHFADGDVLFAKITPCMENGKAAVASNLLNGLGCGTTELHVLRPSPAVDAFFLYHYLHQQSFRDEAARCMTGSAGQLRVPVDFMRNIRIPLPPIAEQRCIVAKLEQLLARVDTCQARLERVPALLKNFRQAVLSAACSGRLTEDWRAENPSPDADSSHVPSDAPDTPNTWEWRRLTDIAAIRGGITKGRKLSTDRVIKLPYLRVANVQDGYLDLSEIKIIEALPEDATKYALKPGDILFTEGGDRDKLGRGAVWHGEIANCVHQNHIFRARITVDGVLPEYISLATKSDYARQYFFDNASQTINLASINLSTLSALTIPVPPVTEQEEIVRRVENLLAFANTVEVRYTTAKAQMYRMTQSILAKAFHGELVPQDPNDEPAEELLRRVQAAKDHKPIPAKPHRASRVTSMSKNAKEFLRELLISLPDNTVTFDELRKSVPYDYESLRDAIFALLHDDAPIIRQVFDGDSGIMRFERITQ